MASFATYAVGAVQRPGAQERRTQDESLTLAVRADATRIATSRSSSFTKLSILPGTRQLERCTTHNQKWASLSSLVATLTW